MVGRALSEAAKKQEMRLEADGDMENALAAFAAEVYKPQKTRRSLRKIAEEYHVSSSSLQRRVRGGRGVSEFNATKQKLSVAEEKVLVEFILESATRGFPMNQKSIVRYANEILEGKEGPGYTPVGHNWCDRFMTRHRNQLQTHWSRPLDMQRAEALRPEVVKDWYNTVKECIEKNEIRTENIYGMDETGNVPSDQGTERVVGGRGTKVQHKQGGADRENVTAIVTICADGSTLKPSLIFKGKNFMSKWGQNNVSNASFAHSPNGWTDGELALNWIEKDFDAQTREKANGGTRLLIMDGHSSHYTLALLKYARANNIVILGYPPHCTHALQGLDVVCFARLKDIYSKEVNAFETLNKRSMTKADFAGVWGRAFAQAFTTETVLAAFRATGISPFNPDVITAEQMKPSKATSTHGSFPLPQTSPIRAVMAALHAHPMTTFDIEEATSQCEPGPSQRRGANTPQSPETPTRWGHRRRVDESIDPTLFTPTKRARILQSSLARTSSGSFLVNGTRITSKHKIHAPVLEKPPLLPEPNWALLDSRRRSGTPYKTREQLERENEELAESLGFAKPQIDSRDGIIEAAHAQMIVQHLLQDGQRESLYAKENKTKEGRQKLFPDGKGRYLTRDDFIAELERQEAEKVEKEAAKERRLVTREGNKSAKADLKARWEAIKAAHLVALAEWEAEVAKLSAEGFRRTGTRRNPDVH